MSRLFRAASSLMAAVGIAYLFVYVFAGNLNRADILNQPSYYQVQNYLFLFAAGVLVLVFSLLGSFFSWFKQFDAGKAPLPNAGYAEEEDIRTWIAGTSMDAAEEKKHAAVHRVENPSDGVTAVLPGGGADMETEPTELLRKEEGQ